MKKLSLDKLIERFLHKKLICINTYVYNFDT